MTKPGGTVQIVDRDWGLVALGAVARGGPVMECDDHARTQRLGHRRSGLPPDVGRIVEPDATPSDLRLLAENERKSMTAADAAAFLTANLDIDVTALAPKVAVPTLVIHCRGDLVVPFEQGRRIATLIPGARLVTLENRNHIFPDGDPVGMQFFLAFTEFLNEDPQRAAKN